MRIAVTLTFDEEVVWSDPDTNSAGFRDGQKRPPCDVTPRVQFCGEFFESGETKELEVFDTYEVLEHFPTPDRPWHEIKDCTNVVAEWVEHEHHNVVWKLQRLCTGHIWSGQPCSCATHVCSLFTPHQLGVKDKEEGSVTTHQGVTIAWERATEEKVA